MESAAAKRPRLSDEDSAGLLAWRRLLLAHSRLMRVLDEDLRREHDVAIGDYDVLIQLARAADGRLRMCELAEAVVLSPSGLTRRVDRLERAGLVERSRSAGDARNVECRLTPAGRRLFKRLRATHVAGLQEHFIEHFDERELEQLAELLGKLPDARAA